MTAVRDPSRPLTWSGDDPYARALRSGRGPLFLRRVDGWLLPLDVERWCATADPVDLDVLARCPGSVLDIGCGPGRLVAALAAQERRVLGIDVSGAAVAHTVRRGGHALRRSVFAPVPGEGAWDSALLLDGNIGIGGDPSALLGRVAELVTADGVLLVETAAVDVDERHEVELMPGGTGDSFPWARLGAPALRRHARRAGWRAEDQWSAGGRNFVLLRRAPRRTSRTSALPAKSAAVISSQRAK
ncbi:methyltransferase domain-containing protein [Streptomyces sp. NPDC088785]|uniref:methyltransferase domain-containing protein n=1 Tax=Streptomyces sp. NPDC088785 TaxID=3365897 RepID=UPI00380BFF61